MNVRFGMGAILNQEKEAQIQGMLYLHKLDAHLSKLPDTQTQHIAQNKAAVASSRI